MRFRTTCLAVWLTKVVWAQAPTAPVISPRGIVNAVTLQPAPSIVARGGIVQISGLNLGPPEGARASGSPLPTKLAEVEVLVNGTAVPLLSVSPGIIQAQVPFDAAMGQAEAVVRRAGQESRPARFVINAVEPSVRTANDSGFGEVSGAMTGQTLVFQASGLGVTEPRVPAGELSPSGSVAKPAAPVGVFVGGARAAATASLSSKRVGEFEVQVDLPPSARPGDVLHLTAGGRGSNRVVIQPVTSPEVQFLPFPAGAPEFRAIETTDLNGSYVVASGARESNGCYAGYLFDVPKTKVTRLENCLTVGNQNSVSPVVAPNEINAMAALVGPPTGSAPNAVSAKALIFSPEKEAPLPVDLPTAVSALAGGQGGNITAIVPGTTPRALTIDVQTGEVREGGALGGGAGQGALALILNQSIEIDGLSQVLSIPVVLPQNRAGFILGDDADSPKKARFIVVNQDREPVLSKDFPEGWLPLVAPRAQAPGGGQTGPGGFNLPRQSSFYDTVRRVYYALAKSADGGKHGLAAFTLDNAAGKVVEFPSGAYVAACTPNIQVFNLELPRRIALVGTSSLESEVKNPCPGQGFIQVDLNSQAAAFVALPSQGQISSGQGATGDINDYIYGTNTDPSRQNRADTLYVFDGVNGAAFRLDLPSGIPFFQNIRPVPELSALIATGTNRTPGDAGLILFDLERSEVRVMPVPEGFVSVALLDVFLATRKVVARGVKSGNAGTQLVIYDLISGDLALAANPEGIVSIGPAAAAGGGAGGPGPGGNLPREAFRQEECRQADCLLGQEEERLVERVGPLKPPCA